MKKLTIMKLWIARTEGGFLFLYDDEPYKNGYGRWETSSNCYSIDDNLFPEVTFENSPQEVELKLCHQTETIKMEDCNPKAQPCVLTNHGIDTNVVKFD